MSSMNNREYKETSHLTSQDWNNKVSEFLKGVSKGNDCEAQCSTTSGFTILVRNDYHLKPHNIQEKSWTSHEENHPYHVGGDYSMNHQRDHYSEKIMSDRHCDERSSRNRSPNHSGAKFTSEHGRHFHHDEKLHSEELSKRGVFKGISPHEGSAFRKRHNMKEGWQSRSPSNMQINISSSGDPTYPRHPSPAMEQFIRTNEDGALIVSNIQLRKRGRQEVMAPNPRPDRKHYSIRSLSDDGSDSDSLSHSRKNSVSMSSDCEKLFKEMLQLKHKRNEIKVQNRLNQGRNISHHHSPYFVINERSNSLDSSLTETEYQPLESQFRYHTQNKVNSRYEEPEYPLSEDELALGRDSTSDGLSELEYQGFYRNRNHRLSREIDREDRDAHVGIRSMNSRGSSSPFYSGLFKEALHSDYDDSEPIRQEEGSLISYHPNRNVESNLRDYLDGSLIHNIDKSHEIVNFECSRRNDLFEEDYNSQRVNREKDLMRVTSRRRNSSEREFFVRTSSRRNRMSDSHPMHHNSNNERLVHEIPEILHLERREIPCRARNPSTLNKSISRLKTRTALNAIQKSRSPARTKSRDFYRNRSACGSLSCNGFCQATIPERIENLKSPKHLRVRSRCHDVSEIKNSTEVSTNRTESSEMGNQKNESDNRSSYYISKRDEDDCNNSLKWKVSDRSNRHNISGSPNSTGESKGLATGSLAEVSCSKRQKTTKKSKCENPSATVEDEAASFFSSADWTTVDSWSIDENKDDKNDNQNKSGDKEVKASEKSLQKHSTYDTKYGQSSRHNKEPESCINIEGLSPHVTEVDLKNVIWQSRVVFKDIRVARDVFTGKSLGYALVKFFNVSDAAKFMDRKKGILKSLNSQGVMKYMSKTTYNKLTDKVMMDWLCVCGTYNEKKLHKCIRCKGYRTNGKVVPLENQINKNVIFLTGLNSLVTVKKVQASLPVLSTLPAGCLRSVRIYSKIGSDTATCSIEMDSSTNAKSLFTILRNEPPHIYGKLVSVEYRQNYSEKKVIKTLSELSNLDKNFKRKPTHQLSGSVQRRRHCKQLGTTDNEKSLHSEHLDTTGTKYIVNPALQENQSLDTPPDGSGSQKYSSPELSSFQYDSSSGYYYDPYTHLYYDVNSQYFYNNQLKKFLYWDSSSSSYFLAPSQDAKEAQMDSIGGENVSEKIKIGLANNSNNNDEKLAKMLSDQKLKAKKKLAAAKTLMKTVASDDISTTQEGDSTTADNSKNPCIDTSSITEIKVVDSVHPSTYEEMSIDSEDQYLDLDSMICLLCKRNFPNEKLLTKHAKESVLHKQNLDLLKGNNLEEML